MASCRKQEKKKKGGSCHRRKAQRRRLRIRDAQGCHLTVIRPIQILSSHFITFPRERERRWFVLERPRRDTNGGSETEVTVTSKLPANAERNKEIEKIQEREEKAASFGGAVRGSVPEDELSGEGVRHSEAESEGGRRPECPG